MTASKRSAARDAVSHLADENLGLEQHAKALEAQLRGASHEIHRLHEELQKEISRNTPSIARFFNVTGHPADDYGATLYHTIRMDSLQFNVAVTAEMIAEGQDLHLIARRMADEVAKRVEADAVKAMLNIRQSIATAARHSRRTFNCTCSDCSRQRGRF